MTSSPSCCLSPATADQSAFRVNKGEYPPYEQAVGQIVSKATGHELPVAPKHGSPRIEEG